MNTAESKVVKALTSGRYQQGTGFLCRNGKHCCLGVACEVLGAEKVVTEDGDGGRYATYDGETAVLPDSIRLQLGWDLEHGLMKRPIVKGQHTCYTLTEMNDAGFTFKDIAKQIQDGNMERHG